MLKVSARPLSGERITPSRGKIVRARNQVEKSDQPSLNPEEFLPAYFHHITNLLSTRLLERLRIYGVTVPRWRVLMNLMVNDGRTIGELVETLRRRGVSMKFGRVNRFLRSDMDRHGLTPVLGASNVFETLHEALAAAGAAPGMHEPDVL